MTQAVTARRDGDAFQARMFWRKAACLLDPESPIVRVGFENGPKGFDDIWVEYNPPIIDQQGRPLWREHIQCKWHVSPGGYGYAELTDPAFINANAHSLLERALKAQRVHAPGGEGVRFRLVTNWRIERTDPLRTLVNQRSSALRLDRLFVPGTDRSAPGRVRKLWRDHLGLNDDRLRLLARTLAFPRPLTRSMTYAPRSTFISVSAACEGSRRQRAPSSTTMWYSSGWPRASWNMTGNRFAPPARRKD